MHKFLDIRPFKKQLRKQYKEFRTTLPQEKKEKFDQKITNKVLNSWSFRENEIILTYVSTAIEVDTHEIITEALERGKTVAAPRCIDGTRDMDFYAIRSFEDLEKGAFGVMEPNPETCEKLPDYKQGLCIVPALAFDKEGFRLGYGKGYYDRFLSLFGGETLGLCYADCLCEEPLPHGKFDKKVSLIITENAIVATE